MKKYSIYNFLFDDNNKYYIYNSLSNFLAELDRETYENLKIEEKEDFSEGWKNYPAELVSAKVFMTQDEERDAIYSFKMNYNINRYQDKFSTLVIAPTYHCNFACPYCYESTKPPIYMDDETEASIIKFIQKMAVLKGLHVTWFGGEPLLNFKRIISLTKKFLGLGIHYDADIITNGFLLDEEKVSLFEELQIKSIQITIDGIGKDHDLRRPHVSGNSSFDKIIKNLDNFYSKNRKTIVNIRVNIDKTNKDGYYQLFTFLKKYPKARVSPSFVFIKDSNCKSFSECIVSGEEKFNFHFEMYKKYGIPINAYPSLKSGECIARHAYSFIIGANGDLFKCFDQIGNSEKSIGNINDGRFNTTLYNRYIVGADQFSEQKCLACKFFPICSGGCPMLRLENEQAGKELYDFCVIMKGVEKEILSLHLEQKRKQKRKINNIKHIN
jgi:uncharacterized protein